MDKTISILFYSAWITSIFSLFNLGEFSITLIILMPIIAFAISIGTLKNYRLRSTGLFFLIPFILIPLITSSLLISEESTITHFIQSIICLLTFTVFSSLDPRFFFPVFSKYSYYFLSLVLIYGIYQFFARVYNLPFDFLSITNLQISDDLGFQRGFNKSQSINQTFVRVSSFFSEPSDYGRFLLLVYPWTLYYKRSLIVLLLVIINVLLTQSLATISIGIFALLFWYLLNYDTSKILKRIIYALLAFLFLIPVINLNSENDTFQSLFRIFKIYEDGWLYLNDTQRFSDTSKIFQFILDKPLFGYGLGSIVGFVENHVVSNLFFLILMERGFLGLILFLSFISYPIFTLKNKHYYYAPLIYYLVIVQILFFLNFSLIYFIPMYAIIGITYSGLQHQNSDQLFKK